MGLVALLWPKPSQALFKVGTSGKGLLTYSDSNTSPEFRQWNSSNTAFGAETDGPTWDDMYRTVIKVSPVYKDFWLMVVNDNGGNLDIRTSSDGGTTWDAGPTVTGIGGTGTSRRFDAEIEQQSGDLIVAYSKNATTNEIGIRRCAMSTGCNASADWDSEATWNPSGTADIVTWIEMAPKPNADELAIAYLTNAALTENINMAIWNGSSNSFGNEADTGLLCDQTAVTPDGIDKCFDVNYETGSGRPVVNWGISAATAAANNMRNTRWNGSSWSTTSNSTSLDPATHVDCESDPRPGSSSIACISIAADNEDVSAWRTDAGTFAASAANLEISSHAAAAGRMFVAMTYLVSDGNARAIGVSADGSDDGVFDMYYNDGSGTTWTTTTLTQAAGAINEENILAVNNPYDYSEALIVFSDGNSDLWATKVTLSGTTISSSDVTSNTALETSLANINGAAFDMAFEPKVPPTKLTQDGYIWENDDGAVDTSSQQAAGNTAITGVKKGERLTLRTQLKNTGVGYTNDDLALFYDRGDGMWSKVNSAGPAITATGNCTDTNWDCSTLEDPASSSITFDSEMVIDSAGQPWVAYYDGANGGILKAAHYVGSGGSGCTSTAWTCIIIDDPALQVAYELSIAIGPNGALWIAYNGNAKVNVAQYVGTGGTGCTGGTNNTAWTCTTIDDPTNSVGSDLSIAFDNQATPWISYRDDQANDLKIAHYVGAGGTGCTAGTNNAAWTCATIDTASAVIDNSIAIDANNRPWIPYFDSTSGKLKVAQYVGTGGTGCALSDWACTTIEDITDAVGVNNSIAFDPAGNAWIAYSDSTADVMKVAKYTGTGTESSCGGGSSNWRCTTVEGASTNGAYIAIAMDSAGTPWISFTGTDGTNGTLMIARYVSSGGNCTDTAWTCATVDDPTNSIDHTASIAFAPDGAAWVAYRDSGAASLKWASLKRGGEITLAPGQAGASGDAISESHADMTAVPNDANRDDADCLTATTWNAGKWFEGADASGLNLKSGSVTSQCTELSFVIDTSQAVPGRTYRFVIASQDSFRRDKGEWRGPISVAAYPTLTIEASTPYRWAKDNMAKFANCTDTAWGCVEPDSSRDGGATSIAMDSTGSPWAVHTGTTSGTDKLTVVKYVGSGGTGCFANPAFTCTDLVGGVGSYVSLAIDHTDKPWIVYRPSSGTSLSLARYVGSGGQGCNPNGGILTDWTCTTIDNDTDDTGTYPSIAFDNDGNPWVSYYDATATSLMVARYVGTGGSGCGASGSTEWTCTTVDNTGSVRGEHTSLAFDRNGTAWVSYYENGIALIVAQYVGSGGSGCSSTEWTCTTVDNSGSSTGQYTSIAIDPNGNPWVSYYAFSDSALRVATKGGSFGTACTGSGWTCGIVDNDIGGTTNTGLDTSIAIDANGNPWVSYYQGANTSCDDSPTTECSLKVAQFVGGTSGNCTSTAWSCTSVDNSTSTSNRGRHTSLAFDASGVPWVSYERADSFTEFAIAKLNLPPGKLTASIANPPNGRNAETGDARYRLNFGASPRTANCGNNSVVDMRGSCALFAGGDADYDKMVTAANERPMYTMAYKTTSNTDRVQATWVGRTDVAPSTSNIKLQAYRFGTTNAWEDLATMSTGSCSSSDCNIYGVPSGTISDYYDTSTLDNWTSRPINGVNNHNWTSITYGNGLFVAVSNFSTGTNDHVMTSPDGINWTVRTTPDNTGWASVTYGNGLFVAVRVSGTGNRVMTSPDGITWTSRTSAADNSWQSVTYGNGLFVAVSSSGTNDRVMTSPDGITWTSRTTPADNTWLAVTYGNGLFVAVSATGTNDRVMTSPDGITWTSRTSAADNSWQSVTYGNGLFVAVACGVNASFCNATAGNRVMTSPDGITWTSRTTPADNHWSSVIYANGLFVAVSRTGTGNRVMTSPDGITWTSRTSAADNDWYPIAYGNGLFVAAANTDDVLMTTSDEKYIYFRVWQESTTSAITFKTSSFIIEAPVDNQLRGGEFFYHGSEQNLDLSKATNMLDIFHEPLNTMVAFIPRRKTQLALALTG